MRKIAVEEAFATPRLISELERLLGSGRVDAAFASVYRKLLGDRKLESLRKKLGDVGAERIRDMDENGIDIQILSLTAPGVQVFDVEKSKHLMVHSNDFLSEAMTKHPLRFYGLFTICPADPASSVREIERMSENKHMIGIILNSNSQGEYLDHEKFEDIFYAAEQHGMPIYLHPSTPSPQMAAAYQDYGLAGPIWGFAAEAGLHALRLILSGVFDKVPRLNVILGHLGEGLPFWINRLDSRFGLAKFFDETGKVEKLKRTPGQYLRDNFFFSTSGMNFKDEISFVCDMLGDSRVLFAIDYPYESTSSAVEGLEACGISEATKEKIYFENCQKLFNRDFF